VLNDEPNVRDETRARVQALVKALNYHPSLSARSLAGRRSYLIGLVYGNPSANYVVDVQHGAMTRCRERGFQLFAHQCSSQGEELIREALGRVDQTHVEGLVIAPPLSESAALIKALERRAVPFVRIAPNELLHASPYVDMFDDIYIARTIWPRLNTVHQPSYDLAYAATGLLLQMLKTHKPPASVRLAYQLVCRESAGPAPPSS